MLTSTFKTIFNVFCLFICLAYTAILRAQYTYEYKIPAYYVYEAMGHSYPILGWKINVKNWENDLSGRANYYVFSQFYIEEVTPVLQKIQIKEWIGGDGEDDFGTAHTTHTYDNYVNSVKEHYFKIENYQHRMTVGDEWVLKNGSKLIFEGFNENGQAVFYSETDLTTDGATMWMVRSGNRNVLTPDVSSIQALHDPLTQTISLGINKNYEISDFTGTDEEISYPVPRNISQRVETGDLLNHTVAVFSDFHNIIYDADELDWLTEEEVEKLNSAPSELNGKLGIWRMNESYFYDSDRGNTGALINSGQIHGHHYFDWNAYPATIADDQWRRATKVTRYSPNNLALEEKDALGNYSCLFTSHSDMLVKATLSNSRYQEAMVEDFETYDDGETKLAKSNFTMNNSKTSHTYISYSYNTEPSYKNLVRVEGEFPTSQIGEIFNIEGKSFESPFKKLSGTYTVEDEKVFPASCPSCSTYTVLQFSGDIFSDMELWQGSLSKTQNKRIVGPGNNSYGVSSDKAHTGNKSLKITEDVNYDFSLYKLSLSEEQRYHINVWVSIADVENAAHNLPSYLINSHYNNYYVSKEPLVQVQFYDQSNQIIDVASWKEFKPTGPIINGWQQIKGDFVVPDGAVDVRLSLQGALVHTPNNDIKVTYFDDIRLHPFTASMQSHVYNPTDYKLSATLDDNNFATLYYYDEEGKLYLTKKETQKGIKTLQYSMNHTKEEE